MSKFKFKPNKRKAADAGWTKYTNGERSDAAEAALTAYPHKDEYDPECNAIDLITDIGHYCDREKVDFERVLRSAQNNWEMER